MTFLAVDETPDRKPGHTCKNDEHLDEHQNLGRRHCHVTG
jgi:hypothetical protein